MKYYVNCPFPTAKVWGHWLIPNHPETSITHSAPEAIQVMTPQAYCDKGKPLSKGVAFLYDFYSLLKTFIFMALIL